MWWKVTAIALLLDQNIINQSRASLIRGAGIYWIFYRDRVVCCEEHGGRRIVKRKLATGKLWIFLSRMVSKKMFITQIALGQGQPRPRAISFSWNPWICILSFIQDKNISIIIIGSDKEEKRIEWRIKSASSLKDLPVWRLMKNNAVNRWWPVKITRRSVRKRTILEM